MRRVASWMMMVGVGFFATACATGTQVQNAPGAPIEARTQVEVTNNNWSDMRVYVDRGGVKTRLGTVTSMTTRLLAIPRVLVSPGSSVRLIADPIGAPQEFVSPTLQVHPGQRVEFTIQNHLSVSSISVWSR
jgi:hypothetical protein